MPRTAPQPPGTLGPIALCDLLLGACLAGRVTCTTLEPCGEGHLLSFKRGAHVLRAIRVDDEAAAGAAVRLSVAAGLDPLPEGDGAANVARIRVRGGNAHEAEVLVSIAARAGGFDVEVRTLLVDGREPVVAARAALRRCGLCGLLQAGHLDACERDGGDLDDLADDPRPGGTIGPWRIESTLGVGGMGRVFAASHALLGREVAIKVMHQSLGRATQGERRFLLEARAASRLRHRAIVEVLDFGVLTDGRPYMVMERLRGRSLVELLANGALPHGEALRIGVAIAEALHAAHEGGVVHNDLKPSNVYVMGAAPGRESAGGGLDVGTVKLIDFGAASLREADEGAPTTVVGTPSYIAPERIMGVVGDARSDLYALGVVLFELISGAPPFRFERPKEILAAHVSKEPPPLASPHGALPKAAAQLVARALRKQPEQRFQSAAEMRFELERALAACERPSWRRWLP